MLLKTSDIKSLGGHTYNRPKPETRLDIDSLNENIPSSLETEMTWWWAMVARSSWGNTRDLVSTFTKTL